MTGILNTALMIVIALDVVGAIVYFTLTCLSRFRTARSQTREARGTYAGGFGGMVPAPAAGPVSAMELYGPSKPSVFEANVPSPEDSPARVGLRQRIESFGDRFARFTGHSNRFEATPPAPASGTASGSAQPDQQVQNQVSKLTRILNSFKEEI